MADVPMKVVKLGTDSIFVAKLDGDVVPGTEYEVELRIKEKNAGPAAASCTGNASCGSFSLT